MGGGLDGCVELSVDIAVAVTGGGAVGLENSVAPKSSKQTTILSTYFIEALTHAKRRVNDPCRDPILLLLWRATVILLRVASRLAAGKAEA